MPREENAAIEFYTDAIEDGAASRDAGRVIFKEVEMCRVLIVGDKDNNLVIRADEPFARNPRGGKMMTPKERYPDHYAAFKRNEVELVSGTPLDKLPFLGKAQIAELNYHGVKTAEQLAAMGEAAVAKGIGWRDWRTQAKAWLEETDKSAALAKSQMENDALMARISALEAAAQKPGKAA